jgi:hypothetical protein
VGEDPRGRLVLEHSERLPRVLAEREPPGALLYERADQRTVLVERRAVGAAVLLERDGNVGAALQLEAEVEEGAQAERAEGAEELGRARRGGHANGYAPAGPVPSWHVGHQYAVRTPSP